MSCFPARVFSRRLEKSTLTTISIITKLLSVRYRVVAFVPYVGRSDAVDWNRPRFILLSCVCVCVCVFDVAIRTKTRLWGIECLSMLCNPLSCRSCINRFASLSVLNRAGEFTFKRLTDFGPALPNHPTYVYTLSNTPWLPTHALRIQVVQYPRGECAVCLQEKFATATKLRSNF